MVVIVTPPPSDYKPLKIKKSEFDAFVKKQEGRLKVFSISLVIILFLLNVALNFSRLNSDKDLTLQLINLVLAIIVILFALKDRRKKEVITGLKNSPGDTVALKHGFTGLFKRDIFVALIGYILVSIIILIVSLS